MERYFADPLLLWMPRKLWQDHKAAIEELETGDPDVQGEDDEGFVELVEYQDLTVPGLETALPLGGTCRPTPTPSTSIQSTAASVSPLSSSPVWATPPPGPLSSTLGLVLPLSYVPVRATPPPGPLSSTLGLVLPLSGLLHHLGLCPPHLGSSFPCPMFLFGLLHHLGLCPPHLGSSFPCPMFLYGLLHHLGPCPPHLGSSFPCPMFLFGYSTTWASVLHTWARPSPVLRSCSG
ncbi:uncharacterized protein [Oncorhynchus clarkii lewisi]|uniref:uncharacterized protein n=1 Tax=Oncorhynchus clarkii lewisi TaxID=490388 RepID=UPI0039B8B71D